MHTTDVTAHLWHKSSYSTGKQNCVEVAQLAESTAVRDSKDRDGPALVFGRRVFTAFLLALHQQS